MGNEERKSGGAALRGMGLWGDREGLTGAAGFLHFIRIYG